MENNEIMINEEVIETTEELVESGSGNGLKIAAGIGILAAVGFGASKLVKGIKKKIESKKESNCETICLDEDDYEESES